MRLNIGSDSRHGDLFEKSIERARDPPQLPPISGTETITHRRKHEFIIAPRLSKPFGRRSPLLSGRSYRRERSTRNTKTTIYDCRRSRSELISPDFTSAPSNRPAVPRSLLFPLISHPLPPVRYHPVGRASGTRQKEIPRDVPRCPSRASQKRAVRSSITTVHTTVASS